MRLSVEPAIEAPIIDNWEGGDVVSECTTANPSIAELSNPGSFTLALISLETIRLIDCEIGIISDPTSMDVFWHKLIASFRETKYGYGLAIYAPKQNLL